MKIIKNRLKTHGHGNEYKNLLNLHIHRSVHFSELNLKKDRLRVLNFFDTGA